MCFQPACRSRRRLLDSDTPACPPLVSSRCTDTLSQSPAWFLTQTRVGRTHADGEQRVWWEALQPPPTTTPPSLSLSSRPASLVLTSRSLWIPAPSLFPSPPSASLCSDTPLCPARIRRRQTAKHTDSRAPASPPRRRDTRANAHRKRRIFSPSLSIFSPLFVCSRTVSLPSFFFLLLLLLLCLPLSQTCCCRALRPLPLNTPLPSPSLMLFLATAAEHTEDLGFAWGAEGPSPH